MSRTAELQTCRRAALRPAALLIIALCVMAHFLVQDAALRRAADLSAQGPSPAGLAFEEVEHQDDLALAVCLPEFSARNEPPAVRSASIHQERQAAFPIRIPPKIA